MLEHQIPVVSIIGPTASGKTNLAINLALKFSGEIVSADSMQIYKEFNILSAKPTAEQMSLVKHHMIDILSITEEFSVAKFTDLAHNFIRDIHERKKLPFLVGGTGLYVDSLLKNTKFDTGNAEKKIDLTGLNNDELMSMLEKVDPTSAERIHLNDTKRLKRAIDFFYTSGYPISVQTQRSYEIKSPYKICKIGLDFRNRETLYERINSRVDEMLDRGLVEEVRSLMNVRMSKTAQKAIGYKEIIPFINGDCTKEEASSALKQATRRYAKRQLTWFRRDKDVNWIFCDEHDSFSQIISRAQEIVSNFNK